MDSLLILYMLTPYYNEGMEYMVVNSDIECE